MNRVEQVLGIPPVVLRGIDSDRAAYLRGPATLETQLRALTRAQLQARYEALLTEATLTETRAARMAWDDAERAEAADEQRQIRKGGNR